MFMRHRKHYPRHRRHYARHRKSSDRKPRINHRDFIIVIMVMFVTAYLVFSLVDWFFSLLGNQVAKKITLTALFLVWAYFLIVLTREVLNPPPPGRKKDAWDIRQEGLSVYDKYAP